MLFETIAIVLVGYWFFRSPLCSACSDWLRGQSGGDPKLREQLEELNRSMVELREETVDLAERVDFTERMLARVREREVLPPR